MRLGERSVVDERLGCVIQDLYERTDRHLRMEQIEQPMDCDKRGVDARV